MSDDSFPGRSDGENKGEDDSRASQSVGLRSDIGTPEGTGSASRLLRVLANERRRFLLATLRGSEDGVASLSELTRAIARGDAEEEGAPVERSPEEVAVSLHHAHLPKLEASGLIEYDEQSGLVRYRGSHAADALVAFVTDEDL